MNTTVHVTHEAVTKVGGIGAVLHGLLTSSVYTAARQRNILVGPFWPHEGEEADQRLGRDGEVLYSGCDGVNRTPVGERLAAIESQFGVSIVYGRRRFHDVDTNVGSTPEVLLIDVSRGDYNRAALGAFKFDLYDKHQIESSRYEHVWDYEQYVRLAQPALACLHALGAGDGAEPCVMLAHEYMGVPTCLAAKLDGGNFRTIFHAHECAPMRRIVENRAGHDTMFYNVMRVAMNCGQYVEDVFGDQSDYYKFALVRATSRFDAIFAVGDYTLAEMRFMGPEFTAVSAGVAYNGVPHWAIDLKDKLASRALLQQYASTLLGQRPDYIFTHVTRLVPSKALWRDLRVLKHVDRLLGERGATAVLLTLSTEVPPRSIADVRRMEAEYGWPVTHREGGSDLSSGEAVYDADVRAFNATAKHVKVVFINQFGFSRETVGDRLPEGARFMDIRKGSDVEFGQSIYEPFGIAQVEPMSFGGICCYTNICGCAGFVARAAGGATPNALVADYAKLGDGGPGKVSELLAIGQAERDALEERVAASVAGELVKRLPRTDLETDALLRRGQGIAENMSWDVVAREYILPGIEKAMQRKS